MAFEMMLSGEIYHCDAGVAREDGEGGAAYRARLGFPGPRAGAMGLADRELLEWYRGEHERGYRYLAEWSDAFEVRLILVRDWPTLLKLRALAAPLLSLVELEVRLEE